MKKLILAILLTILFCPFNVLFAQSDTTNYTVYDYMKVAPNMQTDYINLERAFKKIHAAKKKAGKIDGWSLSVVVSSSNHDYNFVTRNSFRGNAQLANLFEGQYMPDKWESLLTPDEIILVNRAGEIRTSVKQEIYTTVDEVMNDDSKNATVSVFNYFDSPKGKTRGDHYKMEHNIWKPVHAARVKDGIMKGWLLMDLQMPFGSSMEYNSISIDLYSNMNEYLSPWFDKYFKKAHPNKDVNLLLKQTSDAVNLVRGEVRMRIDRLD